ncbi:5-hydroxytryptamine receptor 3A-like [Scomber scombrus]|uniref:5-hydroxytryptamine receptor 3A-like n=1 Tax=Scomber scombrus TaxID=13677 RepID=UPI002DD849C7|nr:5-hydroxytryptamine receptor 3A-like [Scomber scombrus]
MTDVKAADLIIYCFMLLHDPLNITISINVVGILEVDEKLQTLTIFLWQMLEWDIEGLSWDEKECGTKRVSVPWEKLWIPDVQITEFMDEDRSPKSPYIYIHNTGQVFDSKPLRVISSCRLVIYTFPFDIQNCSLTFGSHVHTDSDIRMIQGHTAEEILKESRDVIETNGEWELVDIKLAPNTLVLGDEGNFSKVIYYIVLRRRPILYIVNILMPSCFLITVDIFSFLLPPHSVDRCAFKMTLILGYTVFLLIMNDLLPVTGYTTPLLNVLFSMSFALMVISLLETIFITNIHCSFSQFSTVPHWLSVFVLQYLAVVVFLPPKKKKCITTSLYSFFLIYSAMNTCIIPTIELQSTAGNTPSVKSPQELTADELRKLSNDLKAIRLQMEKHLEGSKISQEWYMIGIVMDRLLFGMYIVFMLVSFITITCIWVLSTAMPLL